ncbi:MAG TPA: transcriptional regulator, partial [Rhodospirillaceae bacterium]|nr:transcriptional regulator [Rhodospirillaceae bacterium]
QDKKSLLQDLASHAAQALRLEEYGLFDMLWEREKLGSTGVGHGIAIPHARVPGLESVQGFFAQMKAPIPFDSVDNQAVDIVFLLLAPEEAGADHLHALACISRALRDQAFCAKLRDAQGQDSIMLLLRSVEAVKAA